MKFIAWCKLLGPAVVQTPEQCRNQGEFSLLPRIYSPKKKKLWNTYGRIIKANLSFSSTWTKSSSYCKFFRGSTLILSEETQTWVWASAGWNNFGQMWNYSGTESSFFLLCNWTQIDHTILTCHFWNLAAIFGEDLFLEITIIL